jgi:hypothetical protein
MPSKRTIVEDDGGADRLGEEEADGGEQIAPGEVL